MKVAFIANTTWNIYNFRKGLVQHFLEKGDEVFVLSPEDEYVDVVKSWGVKWINTPIDGTGMNPLKDLRYLWRIISIFKKEKPDIALGYTIKSNIYSCIAGRITNVPLICNVSGLGTVFLVEGITGFIANTLYKISFKYAKQVFFQNEDDRQLFTSKIPLLDHRVGTLPGSGINLDEFPYSEVPLSMPVKFLMISRIIVEKGVREFAEAATHFKDDDRVSFLLVGKLDESHSRSITLNELQEWVDKGAFNYLPHTDKVKELLNESEVIILPSYREGTPRTLLEGAATGRALLSSNVPGCREVVEDGFNGFLFEPKNSKSLLDKIKLYLSLTESEKRSLSRNSRKLVEDKFDENLVIDKYIDAIDRIKSSS